MTDNGPPQRYDTYLNSWSDIARARRELTRAKTRVRKVQERYDRELPAAKAGVARAEAAVRYHEALIAADASSDDGSTAVTA